MNISGMSRMGSVPCQEGAMERTGQLSKLWALHFTVFASLAWMVGTRNWTAAEW